jgi:signal transduction histidine kinase
VPYGYAKVTRDVTERRAAEDRERRLLAEQQARLAAEEALKVRDRFLSIASHELKTPVTSLQLSTEALVRARALGKLDDARLAAALGRMTTATNRLGVLVNELLDITRLTSELLPFNPTPTDIAALTRDVVDRMADHYEPGRVNLLGDATATVLADPSRVDQVIANLLDNALKYSGDAPITVTVAAAEGGVLVSVLDDGIGLDVPGDRLFEAFGRGPNAEHVQGMGLGLFIARQIVERHGGRISGSPRAGGGSAFTVWLPTDPPQDDRAAT